MKKPFIITIDTESDNQWDYKKKQSTENAFFIPRFQELCEKFNYKPVYLVDYSMANNLFLVEYLRDRLKKNKCEVGMHLHAWDTPPFYCEIDSADNICRPYLIEYPIEFIQKKIETMHLLLSDRFMVPPITHRAGRWATDINYLDILDSFGYKIDCSFTPGINWSNTIGYTKGGSNYSKIKNEIQFVGSKKRILEVPTTISNIHILKGDSSSMISVIKDITKFFVGRNVWFRPALSNEVAMEKIIKQDNDYLEFMMHSSEFMPGGSPYYKDEYSIEKLYKELERIFRIVEKDYVGMTLKELYYNYCKKEKNRK